MTRLEAKIVIRPRLYYKGLLPFTGRNAVFAGLLTPVGICT